MKLLEDIYLVGSGSMGLELSHPNDCNVFLIDGGTEQALIDAGSGLGGNQILYNVRELGFSPHLISKICLTHIHADHAGGGYELKKKTGAKIAVHLEASHALETANEEIMELKRARAAGFYPEDYTFNGFKVDIPLREGDDITVGKYKLKVVETLGHSRFDLSFIVTNQQKKKIVFCGDTVFYDGKISMLSTRDFDLQSLANSVEKLDRFNIDVLLAGHLQPILNRGNKHVSRALNTFQKLGVPKNI